MKLSRRNFMTTTIAFFVSAASTTVLGKRGEAATGRSLQLISSSEERKRLMVAEMKQPTFAPFVNSQFQIKTTADQTIPLKLIEVSENPVDSRLEQFSLIFQGSKDHVLLQNTYEFEHPQLGQFALFIAPIVHRDQTQVYYQAAFSRLV